MIAATRMIQVGDAAIVFAYFAVGALIIAVTCGAFDWAADRYNAWADRRDDEDHVAWWSTRRLHIDVDEWGRR